jgi:hypothetical protein
MIEFPFHLQTQLEKTKRPFDFLFTSKKSQRKSCGCLNLTLRHKGRKGTKVDVRFSIPTKLGVKKIERHSILTTQNTRRERKII